MRRLSASEEETMKQAVASVAPMNIDSAAEVLREMKRILDDAGVRFFLRQGTCLGAIRDNALIPWDDDLDLGSVIGLHGLTEEMAERVAATFREKGYIVKQEHQDHGLMIVLVKDSIRTEWCCFRIFGDSVYQYPAVRTPLRLFTDLEEIEFLGEKFLVPSPPEEYLRLKYGDEWKTPKKSGSYETDVLALISNERAQGRAGWLKQTFARYISGRSVGRLRVLDHQGEPVAGAEVLVAGLGTYRTNRHGYARLYIPKANDYALVIRFGDHEELLYMELVSPGKSYVYRPDSDVTSGRYGVLALE